MIKHIRFFTLVAVLLFFGSCESKLPEQPAPGTEQEVIFPSYITVAEDYFETSIGNIPEITSDSYQLRISGVLEEPGTFSLEELFELEMFSQTLTTECIGNPGNGNLLGTTRWSGFKVYDLLKSLGIKEEASAVRFLCANSYCTPSNYYSGLLWRSSSRMDC